MRDLKRKVAFVLVNCAHGTFIMNRLDYQPDGAYGGNQILEAGTYEPKEVDFILALLELRRRYFGDGVVAIDCGANIGVHTVEWSRRMTEWGSVIAIEAQERLFYCLAGNIAINNCFNARAIHAAVGAADGMMSVPTLDYLKPARFGSVELKQRDNPEFIGQAYGPARASVPAMRLDALKLERIDLIKIDVEGMELDVLEGARASIDQYHPILTIETIKTDFDRLTNLLAELDYQVFQLDRINIAAIHRSDKTASHIKSA
jgi:FkbM family methyltransferase